MKNHVRETAGAKNARTEMTYRQHQIVKTVKRGSSAPVEEVAKWENLVAVTRARK